MIKYVLKPTASNPTNYSKIIFFLNPIEITL